MALTVVDGGLLSSTNAQYTGFKNRIINGAMVIDQRNNGASKSVSIGTVTYTLDRWFGYATGAAITIQQVASGVTNNPYLLQITGAASVTSAYACQRIESKNIADLAGSVVTLSFQASCSTLTTMTWGAYYASSVDNFTSTPTIATGNITINSTLTAYNVSFTLPANAANGIEIDLSVGALTSGTFKIGLVQLEKGSTATSFDYRPYGTELQLCQRYYSRFGGNSAYEYIANGMIYSTTLAFVYSQYPVTMRATPSVSFSTLRFQDEGLGYAATSISIDAGGTAGAGLQITTAGTMTAYHPGFLASNNSTSAYLAFSAEL